MAFDKATFSSLLKKAIGKRTQKKFAEEIRLSKEHLSRLIHQKYDNPPSLDTIIKIANHSTEVTYEELLEAAGYGDKISVSPPANPVDKSKIIAAILSNLPQLGMAWSVESQPAGIGDLTIHMKGDSPVKLWHFLCSNQTDESLIRNHMGDNYVSLIFEEIQADEKYSFVTASIIEYESYRKRLPKNLSVNLSVIYVNIRLLQVVKETILSTHHTTSINVLETGSFPLAP